MYYAKIGLLKKHIVIKRLEIAGRQHCKGIESEILYGPDYVEIYSENKRIVDDFVAEYYAKNVWKAKLEAKRAGKPFKPFQNAQSEKPEKQTPKRDRLKALVKSLNLAVKSQS